MSSLGRLFSRVNHRFPLQVMRGAFRHYTLVLGMHMSLVPAEFRVTLIFVEAGTVIYFLTLWLFVLSCLFVVFFVVVFIVAAAACLWFFSHF